MSPACPFCHRTFPVSEIERHANTCLFDKDYTPPAEHYTTDFQLAQQMAQIDEYSSECRPDLVDIPESSSSGASFGGRNYDQNHVTLVNLQQKGEFYKVQGDLMTLLRNCLESESNNSTSILSGHVDHFQSIASADAGWGCGWRNIQMLSSYLLSQRPEARKALYGGSGFVPDIESLQRWLELAWEKGFDTPGSHEFGQKIYGKKKWIGTTECATILRYFGLRAMIADFSSKDFRLSSQIREVGKKIVKGPMDIFLSKGKLDSSSEMNKNLQISSEKGHHLLTKWVWKYFSDNNVNRSSGDGRVVLSGKGPLYFQHDGHSRTIVGIQEIRQSDGKEIHNLLVLDPSVTTRSLEQSLRKKSGWQKLIKRGVHTLRKPCYQLCYVEPGIASGVELESLKTISSILHEF